MNARCEGGILQIQDAVEAAASVTREIELSGPPQVVSGPHTVRALVRPPDIKLHYYFSLKRRHFSNLFKKIISSKFIVLKHYS